MCFFCVFVSDKGRIQEFNNLRQKCSDGVEKFLHVRSTKKASHTTTGSLAAIYRLFSTLKN